MMSGSLNAYLLIAINAVLPLAAQDSFRPAEFQGLRLGQATIADAIERLGEPVGPFLDGTGTTWLHYKDVGRVPGKVEVMADSETGVIGGVTVYATNLSMTEARDLFGPGYEVKRYAFDDCLGDAESAPVYESVDGNLEYTVYKELGIAIRDSGGSSLSIGYLSQPPGAKESQCEGKTAEEILPLLGDYGRKLWAGGEAQGRGRYEDAETYFRAALEEAEKLGPEHPRVAHTLRRLAELYHLQGKSVEAESLCERSLAILEKALGPEDPSVAGARSFLGRVYEAQGRYAEAAVISERSLAIMEKTRGRTHLTIAPSLRRLAGLYAAQGKYGEAEPLYKRALAIFENNLGPEYADVAITLYRMAEIYQAQRRYAEAEPLFKRALGIQEKIHMPGDASILESLERYAAFLRETGRDTEAARLEARAAEIRKRAGR